MKGIRRVRLFSCGIFGVGTVLSALPACGNSDRRASLISIGGQSNTASYSGQGGDSGDAGQGIDMAGSDDERAGNGGERAANGGSRDDGAAGVLGMPAFPHAIFPEQFAVDVGCGQTPNAASLALQNDGAATLTISSLSADSNYQVDGELPLEIAPGASSNVLVTAPAPKTDAKLGQATMGTLTFTTNEPGTATHHIVLVTTLFGGQLEFLDKNGKSLPDSSLSLAYSSPDECPQSTSFRVHNTGNLAFELIGPTFPVHFGGTSTGPDGVTIAPDGYVEFKVGAVAASGEVCSGSGQMTFTAGNGFCGAVPALGVVWPAGSLSNCVCTAPIQ